MNMRCYNPFVSHIAKKDVPWSIGSSIPLLSLLKCFVSKPPWIALKVYSEDVASNLCLRRSSKAHGLSF